MRPYSQFLDQLRTAGLRPTRQRLALAKLLFGGEDRHVTAEILHDEAQRANVRVSLATVYNTLHQFTDVGLLREIAADASKAYFDTNTTKHHHFYLADQGMLMDIPGDEINVDNLPTAPEGTKVDSIDVVIRVSNN
ncbi:MAG: transcriptional repressor [Rhodospirillaceae bacterium]|jgi:Fur family transcriptional regulator, iron response regulator|nr:transcriptional repressor [Rhodospirillaceae bacterium]MBT4219232.1 transcriptional repressor [Rhodospirillaceae bacterium]MBT4463160.1 transcriptional repressor [Rhodospirillaceae bacterium]MBT5014417.1 transcriptional repressor [Rhodospirillaceae bacterium]MBT5309682.1 transcriptional repressor [Rhodospirillaceae bacterium]